MELAYLQGKTLAGRFRLESVLGSGGYGAVFEAVQLSIDRRCAVKVLFPHLCDDESTAARFRSEARTTSRLTHPNSITIFDFGRDEELGVLFLAMELLDGRDLRSVIKEDGPLGVGQAVEVCRRVAASLQEAHQLGLVHRDIKPHNIMVGDYATASWYVKVIDFGIAKVVRASLLTVSDLTRTGAIVGTPKYMAPEQIRDADIDGRTDMYGLAISVYQMLTGRTPFDGQAAMEIAARQVAEAPAPLRDFRPDLSVGRQVELVLLKALEKQPRHRFDDVSEFVEALEAAVDARPGAPAPPVGPDGVLGGSTNRPRRRPADCTDPDGATRPLRSLTATPPPAIEDDGTSRHELAASHQHGEAGIIDDYREISRVSADDYLDPQRPANSNPAPMGSSTTTAPIDAARSAASSPPEDGFGDRESTAKTLAAADVSRKPARTGTAHSTVDPAASYPPRPGVDGLGDWRSARVLGTIFGAAFIAAAGAYGGYVLLSGPTRSVHRVSKTTDAGGLKRADGSAVIARGRTSPDPLALQPPAPDNAGWNFLSALQDGASWPETGEADDATSADVQRLPDGGVRTVVADDPTSGPARSDYYRLSVRVIPWGTLYLDGRRLGRDTRHTLHLRGGTHQFVVKQSGRVRVRRSVDVNARSAHTIELVAQ